MHRILKKNIMQTPTKGNVKAFNVTYYITNLLYIKPYMSVLSLHNTIFF